MLSHEGHKKRLKNENTVNQKKELLIAPTHQAGLATIPSSWVVYGYFCVKGRSCAIDVREEVQCSLLALESGQRDTHACGGFGGPAHACNVTGP